MEYARRFRFHCFEAQKESSAAHRCRRFFESLSPLQASSRVELAGTERLLHAVSGGVYQPWVSHDLVYLSLGAVASHVRLFHDTFEVFSMLDAVDDVLQSPILRLDVVGTAKEIFEQSPGERLAG